MDISKYNVDLDQLTWKADVSEFKFKTTEEVELPTEPINVVKGQHYAKETILRAIESKRNVLLLGPAGCGKSLLATTVAEQYAKNKATDKQLYDQILIPNFLEPNSPDVLNLPTPGGTEFKADLISIMNELPTAVSSGWMMGGSGQNYNNTPIILAKNTAFHDISYSTNVGNLIKTAEEKGGYKLIKNAEQEVENTGSALAAEILELDGDVYALIDVFPDLVTASMQSTGGVSLEYLISKYEKNPEVMKFFNLLTKNVGENLGVFKVSFFDNYTGQNPMTKKAEQEKYSANIIVDNSETIGLPVQFIENPTIQNLMGEAGHDALNMKPAHTRCQAGKLHKANGGIVIIDELITVLQNQYMRNYLLTVLQEKKGRIGGGGGLSGGGTSAGIETQPVNADCIVIGCANEDLLQLLTPKIARRFQYKVTLDATMENTPENRQGYSEFVKFEVGKYNKDPKNKIKIPHCTPNAVSTLIERGVRMAQSHGHGKDKLTNILDPLGQIIVTSGLIANEQKSKVIDKKHINEAIAETRKINSQLEDRMINYILDNFIKIDTDGKKVGVVNGLAVSQDQFGLVSYGFPAGVKASVSEGKSNGIEYIDEDSNLGGDF
ncbi:MAG: AAA family ATPase, partial [Nanoarchaeota archaeon]|nr:AAA family ATPase [Nanoarchaeota archaeon]